MASGNHSDHDGTRCHGGGTRPEHRGPHGEVTIAQLLDVVRARLQAEPRRERPSVRLKPLLAAVSAGAFFLKEPPRAEAAPVNTSPPAISGVLEPERTLTATTGTWTDKTSPIVVYEAGATFEAWQGACYGSAPTCSVTLGGRGCGGCLLLRSGHHAAGSAPGVRKQGWRSAAGCWPQRRRSQRRSLGSASALDTRPAGTAPGHQLPSWHHVLHAQALRNALVHNQGQYTRAYLKTKLAYRPTDEDLHGFAPSADDAGLIDHEVIPLSLTLADAVITQLRAAATEVREAIDQARRN